MTNNSSNKAKLTSDRIANLSPSKRALLALHLKQQQADASPAEQSIPRRSKDGLLPLSFSQQRLWLLNQLEPDSPVYNIPKAVRIDGPLQADILRQTLEAIIARHATLRTTFSLIDNDPYQIVSKDWSLNLPVINLSHLPQKEKDDEVQRVLDEHTIKPFDLTRDLLLRPLLIQIEPKVYILLLVAHHIASDGWSSNILFQEISTIYTALSKGEAPSLPELPIQYTDFALWQREQLQGEVLERQLAYWKEQLKNAPPILELPTDHARTTVKTSFGGRQSITLPKSLYDALNTLSKQHKATLFMTLLAAFKVLLYRYTAQEHMVAGTPIANRTRLEIENLIGFFVNTLVMHTDLSGNPTFQEVLARVRDVALGAYAHQDLPFEKLVEALQPERHLHVNPLFQVMFIFQDASNKTLTLPGLTVSNLPKKIGTEQFDLTLSMYETAAGLSGYLTYNADLFESATIERMIRHFQTLLEGIVANPEMTISQLSLLTDTERQQLLVGWNDTGTSHQPNQQCIHHLFEAQAAQTPEAIAVISGDEQLTYLDLNQRANQLAHHLRRYGVGPETLVGICMERSLDMIIGLMAILKAGAGYVPLDPTYPKDRLTFIAEDAQVSILLTQSKLLEIIPEVDAQIINLDTDWSAIHQEPQADVASGVTGDNVAYVMYTSGSTGQPKGVVVLHRGVCNYLLWRKRYFPLTETDRVLQKTSFSFVDSVWELFEPLMVGAQLIMAEPNRHQDPAYLVKFIAEKKITAADFIPSLLYLFLDEKGVEKCTSLRRVTTGSESVTVDLQERFFARLKANLYNLYGPTEASIASTCWTCQPDDVKRSVPIGRPIANTQIYLLDKYLQPVPIGLPGEVHIGGIGLARGYLNRPELTAEKFVNNPFNDDPEARLYKTGDLARYLPGGNIEFLGRVDHQVKIRGYRIELGEVEAFVKQYPLVQEAAAIVREDGPGDKRLVAYIVPVPEKEINVSQLRNYLKEKLPEYMVPSAFVTLDALPLTPNGKLDRKALPTPHATRPELGEAFVAPEGPVEEMLAEIWQEVLKVEKIGSQDNFFELGGHSLLAVQVISRLLADYEVELPLHQLFETPTIADLAAIVEKMLISEMNA